MPASPQERRATAMITGVLAVVILLPSVFGFGSKLLEFIALLKGDVDGAFAISPVANYILASTGFFFLLMWAASNGMFYDIEEPKHAFLEQERELNASGPARLSDTPCTETSVGRAKN